MSVYSSIGIYSYQTVIIFCFQLRQIMFIKFMETLLKPITLEFPPEFFVIKKSLEIIAINSCVVLA